MADKIRVGTRGSLLARAQTRWVVERLQERFPGQAFEEVVIRTQGDKVRDRALSRIGGKGLFVKELEEALQRGEIDFAVHSLKDLPTSLPGGLMLAAVPEREEAADALVLPLHAAPVQGGDRPLPWLAEGARVGTSSLRRQAQLRHLRPDLRLEDIRGNLDTRLRKLDEGQYDALVLAAAGLRRMGWGSRIHCLLPPEVCLPAAGQGALALECRAEDEEIVALLRTLHHEPTAWAVRAERALLEALQGGCQVPLGAWAEVQGDQILLHGMIATVDGRRKLLRCLAGPVGDPEGLGRRVAQELLQAGGAEILASLRPNPAPFPQ